MGFMDWVHGTLDVAGMVPVIGEVADGLNAGLYAAQGDYVNAGISLAGMLPVGGQAVTGTRLGAKVLKEGAEQLGKRGGREVIEEGVEQGAKELAEREAKEKAAREAAERNVGSKVSESPPTSGGVEGGPHSQTKHPPGDGKDSHHMPDRNADPNVSPEDGPAIKMDPADHHATSSNGRNGLAGKKYRAETAQMIQDGKYRDAMAREIRDVRRAAQQVSGDATKYNKPIQQMLDYARSSGQLPPKVK